VQNDAGNEWQRLTALYRDKSDEELLELSEDFGNLTDVAQEVLRDELRGRGLAMATETKATPTQEDRRPVFGAWSRAIAEQNGELDDDEEESGEDTPVEYTWKTLLRTCDTREEAWQLSEMLKRAGIESWIEAPAQGALDLTGPRVMVAADEQERAGAIAAQPVPQEIIDQSKVRVEDFVPPACPKCGAEDLLLESVDPTNRWRCEVCGAEWSEAGPSVENAGQNPA
jgi:ribosomal protein S27AE